VFGSEPADAGAIADPGGLRRDDPPGAVVSRPDAQHAFAVAGVRGAFSAGDNRDVAVEIDHHVVMACVGWIWLQRPNLFDVLVLAERRDAAVGASVEALEVLSRTARLDMLLFELREIICDDDRRLCRQQG
jgi:hypothetical protein